MKIDQLTRRWIRNESDERAAHAGCRFDEERGQFVVAWIRDFLCLYEGDKAGEPFELEDDWQYDATMRLFGWVDFSKRWNREIRRFTRAGLWVPKKNKKSPTLAAWAIYTFAGDGEAGQKVYLAAKDGTQAREIAGRHALEMVQASPELMAVCKINRSSMQIAHLPSRSILKPLSSSNSRTQQSKEGLNGSIFVDETHVVDREFVSRISRAGISRAEPLFVQLSTAGNDPEGYGKSEFDYGLEVEAGRIEDQSYLFVGHYAPQDLSDEELAADPVKYGQMANPAWGRTVHEAEYLADYNRSKQSLTELANFKMYRLNIWQQSANPFLNIADWSECEDQFSEDDLAGARCWAGLDLAKTRDTTALVLIFPHGIDDEGRNTYRQLAYFWIPERTAHRLRDKVRYLEWSQGGHITLTPGDTCDYAYVERQIVELFQQFSIQQFAFDDHYASQLVQRLIDEHGLGDDSTFLNFPQTMSGFAGATAAYERAVIEHTLHHNGNPVLTWQVGNVNAKEDANGNMRPVKQKRGDHRTVDGVVAGIMAFELATKGEGESWYERNRLLVL